MKQRFCLMAFDFFRRKRDLNGFVIKELVRLIQRFFSAFLRMYHSIVCQLL